MTQPIEKQPDSLAAIAAKALDVAPDGWNGVGHNELSKLMSLMHQASKPHYFIRTIPACNSDD